MDSRRAVNIKRSRRVAVLQYPGSRLALADAKLAQIAPRPMWSGGPVEACPRGGRGDRPRRGGRGAALLRRTAADGGPDRWPGLLESINRRTRQTGRRADQCGRGERGSAGWSKGQTASGLGEHHKVSETKRGKSQGRRNPLPRLVLEWSAPDSNWRLPPCEAVSAFRREAQKPLC